MYPNVGKCPVNMVLVYIYLHEFCGFVWDVYVIYVGKYTNRPTPMGPLWGKDLMFFCSPECLSKWLGSTGYISLLNGIY